MAYVVIYDANALYPAVVRDVLIRVAQSGLVQARWTDLILDETFSSLRENRPDLDPARLTRTRELVAKSVRDANVTGYEPIIETIAGLPDPKDRHVVAAAIRAHAQTIVTFNMRDFPRESLARWDLEAKHPDDFMVDQFHLDGTATHRIMQQLADSWRNPPGTVNSVLDALERAGLVRTAELHRR